jgi:hypothetical protein
MARQMTVTGKDRTIGWLTWWTLRKGEYSLADVQNSADDLNVDSYIQNRLKGRSRESAWKRATQLGAAGMPIPSSDPMVTRRLVTRNAVPGDSSIRCLVIEETDTGASSNEEWVTSYTAAVLELASGVFRVEWSERVRQDSHYSTIVDAVNSMQDTMFQIEGRIDDGRIRAAVLGWLEQHHRITVRGAGGVYLVPCSHTWLTQEQMETEMLAIRDWLKTIDSPFSVVAMTEAGAHSIEDFVEDAVTEIKTELKAIDDKVKKWEGNANMNDGSRSYSAGTQLERMAEITKKVEVLKDSLGEEIGVVDEMVSLVKARISAMAVNASNGITASKAKRARERAKKAEGKKSGTAAKRNKKRAL